ncbi:sensor histidine kinase [Alkalicoccobacillus plakortidis]|uniref:histidine kinase n=1 Tax=Alkalicoccobacillus plakortidis TaxID=444060 RepID=A0ABT0XGG6_9BACI|nr:ATP-binding protein [Alkalicoccobacillus plakortidis]MCM2675001.1 ATP-binding protein [Alkalicoccobacillus plakortidis]
MQWGIIKQFNQCRGFIYPGIIKETAERISHSFNREIQLSADENIYVLGHENTIKQLLFILLENGIKYSEQALHVQLYSDQNQATIEIKDTGIGIPLQDQPQIFERFFRVSEDRNRQSGGSGLGLSIAKKIVEQYSGTIRVHSELGKGSTFIVSLPIHQSEEE